MAFVTLADAWIHLASDPSQYVVMRLSDMSAVPARPVEVRRYAGGRVRTISRPGVKTELSLSFAFADRDDVTTLEGWIGVPVMFRDPRGRKLWGVYAAVDETEMAGVGSGLVDVVLSISEISWTEAV